jgi:hypothetical protein
MSPFCPYCTFSNEAPSAMLPPVSDLVEDQRSGGNGVVRFKFRNKISTSIIDMRVGSNELVLIIYNLGFLLNITSTNSRTEMNVAQSDQAEPDAPNSDVLKNDETVDNEFMSPIYRTRYLCAEQWGPIDGTIAGDCRIRCWGSFPPFFFFF